MRVKLEGTLKRTQAQPGASPQHARKIAVPVVGVIAVTAVLLGLTTWSVIRLLPTGRGTNTGPQAPPSAVFLKSDTTTQGTWKGKYGSAGFALAKDAKNIPAYARITLPGKSNTATWLGATGNVRALEKIDGSRTAATWWAWSSFTIDVDLTDDKTHRVSLYSIDWDSSARVENIEVLDAIDQRVLDVRQVSKFAGGEYLVWNMTGHVTIRVTRLAGANAAVSAVFFD